MLIAFDMLIVEQEQGEALFATQLLLDKLAVSSPEYDYLIITGSPQKYQFLAIKSNVRIHLVKLRRWQGLLTQHQLLLPKILKQVRPDILHVPDAAAPIGWKGPLVMEIHNLSYFEEIYLASYFHAQLYWKHLLRESLCRAQSILVSSEKVRKELLLRWPIHSERIHVVAHQEAVESTLRVYREVLEQREVKHV
ncbi:glycosyltransferase [Tengunoibacter tsumagoiensis]|uniref:Glycosyltransferase subfamily 4-like N-terminal domain-containing protein n=1 Tax=Tengunoibacter tsumagoiensis TaxID=2014871 RepID=A0A401ZUU1_9CHLR|nr:glycosyltransferase [Tengunoibacter tsumagoiensis]GCE10500.1 hypothetical protein KTT_03590 [Tengunoibacter tsumagoiensis]